MVNLPLIERRDLTSVSADERTEKTIWGLYCLELCLRAEKWRNCAYHNEVKSRLHHAVSDYYHIQSGMDILIMYGYLPDSETFHDIRENRFSIQEPNKPELSKRVIGITGRIRAGKETAGFILEQEYGGKMYEFADALIAFALALGFKPHQNRAEMREVDGLIKPIFGDDTFAVATLRRAAVQSNNTGITFIGTGGHRSAAEAELILAQPTHNLIEITASFETRLGRAYFDSKKPGQNAKNAEQFGEDDEIEWRTKIRFAVEKTEAQFDNDKNDRGEHLRSQLTTYFDPIFGVKH